jgi:small nuclear ribonucleoprotein (snRNP)-like protein
MNWKDWIGKKVFVRTRHGKVFVGIVETVDDTDSTMIFISLSDKFNKPVTLVHSEIVEIKEEKEDEII